MKLLRSVALFALASAVLAGCEGTQTGHTLFGTPSNNIIVSLGLSLPVPPSRAAGATTQVIPLNVTAYDRWGNVITVTYNTNITVSSNSNCEVTVGPYTSEGTPPSDASFSYNTPTQIGIAFNPNCGGPNPVTITASATGSANTTISF